MKNNWISFPLQRGTEGLSHPYALEASVTQHAKRQLHMGTTRDIPGLIRQQIQGVFWSYRTNRGMLWGPQLWPAPHKDRSNWWVSAGFLGLCFRGCSCHCIISNGSQRKELWKDSCGLIFVLILFLNRDRHYPLPSPFVSEKGFSRWDSVILYLVRNNHSVWERLISTIICLASIKRSNIAKYVSMTFWRISYIAQAWKLCLRKLKTTTVSRFDPY